MENKSTTKPNYPTFEVKLIRSASTKKAYPVKVGVTFATKEGNHRIVWDVLPAESELRDSILILAPFGGANNG